MPSALPARSENDIDDLLRVLHDFAPSEGAIPRQLRVMVVEGKAQTSVSSFIRLRAAVSWWPGFPYF